MLHGVEAVVPKNDIGQLANLLAEAGATLAQGIGLRNNLYREKQAAGRAMKLTRELPATWNELPAASSSLQVPPLDLMRRMVASRAIPRNGKLTIKLASGLVEALVRVAVEAVDIVPVVNGVEEDKEN